MPTSPKFGNGSRLIRGIKVHIEMKTQQERNADGYIAISGKVAINL